MLRIENKLSGKPWYLTPRSHNWDGHFFGKLKKLKGVSCHNNKHNEKGQRVFYLQCVKLQTHYKVHKYTIFEG